VSDRNAWTRAAGAVAIAAALCAGCASEPQEGANGTDEIQTPPVQPPGHQRMVELLDQLRREAVDNNHYVGEGQAPELRAALAALPPEPDLRRWLFHKLLCKHEGRLGNWQTSIDHCRAAYEQLPLFRDEIPPEEARETVVQLGVAWLRLGVVRNSIERRTPEADFLPVSPGGRHVDPQPARTAAGYFLEVLGQSSETWRSHIKARWLLNITAMYLGEYPSGVPEPHRIGPEVFRSEEEFPNFPDIAPRLGMDTFSLSGGVIADDFDNDGDLDLMVSTADLSLSIEYWRNDGDGRFSNRTRAAGLEGFISGQNMVQADYDNDGYTDVLVLRGAWWRNLGQHPNSLLRNNGNGTFSDVTFAAGLAEVNYPTQAGDWADYDNDGDLDLYIGNESDQTIRAPSQLFRNNGDGTFTDVAVEAGVDNVRFCKSAKWGDYDGDRLPDIYASNLGEENRLYHNNGDGTFTDVARELGVTRPLASFPSRFWDVDNDGVLDLFVAGYGAPGLPPEVTDVAASYLGLAARAELDQVYRGDGRGGFEPVGPQMNIKWVTLPMGANFGDLDYDGYLDYYLATGYPYYEGLMPNVMMHNREGKAFYDVTYAGGFGHLQKGHGVAFADLDDDGDQDVFTEMGGMWGGDGFFNSLFENPGFGNHWLKVKLVGVQSNRSAIGARIRVDIVDGGRRRSVYRHVTSGGTFGANPLRQEVGLGQAERIELLEIYWPTSDTTQRFRDVPLDRSIVVTEGVDSFTIHDS